MSKEKKTADRFNSNLHFTTQVTLVEFKKLCAITLLKNHSLQCCIPQGSLLANTSLKNDKLVGIPLQEFIYLLSF